MSFTHGPSLQIVHSGSHIQKPDRMKAAEAPLIEDRSQRPKRILHIHMAPIVHQLFNYILLNHVN